MAKKTVKRKSVAKRTVKRAKKVASIVARVEKKNGKYAALLQFNEQQFIAHGDTALEAFNNLKVPVVMVKTKVMLYLSDGQRESSQIFYSLQLRRFITGRVVRQIWAKRMETKLK